MLQYTDHKEFNTTGRLKSNNKRMCVYTHALVCVYVCIYIYMYVYICTYILFQILSIIGCYKVLNIVLCAM